MLFTTSQIAAWLGEFMWPLMRVGMVFTVAPIFGGRLVPMKFRVLMALIITWVITGDKPQWADRSAASCGWGG